MEGHGRSYPNTRCVNNVRKVTGGGWVVACRIIVLSPGPDLCYSQRPGPAIAKTEIISIASKSEFASTYF